MKTEVAAYYFPQFHPDPRNDAWHGQGWTEWELVNNATPRFPGHRQPILPAWGCFDESDPAWAAKEIDLAADHGVTTFLFDYYWYTDGPFLEDALNRGFLAAPNSHRMKFALMWANHDWTNIHPTTFRNKPEVLAPGRVGLPAFERMTDRIIRDHFSRPNYLTFNGCPYFMIYEVGTFISDMGGLPAARAVLDRFREKVIAAGHPGLHLVASVWGMSVLQGEVKISDPAQVARELNFQSCTSYAWVHHFHVNSPENFPFAKYTDAAEANYKVWEKYAGILGVPYHPNVSMGWDPSPRTIQSDRYENRGYPFTKIFMENTPVAFRDALAKAKAFIDRQPFAEKMITINAWNEWTEGSYLLPDTVHGNAYLEAIRDVFGD